MAAARGCSGPGTPAWSTGGISNSASGVAEGNYSSAGKEKD